MTRGFDRGLWKRHDLYQYCNAQVKMQQARYLAPPPGKRTVRKDCPYCGGRLKNKHGECRGCGYAGSFSGDERSTIPPIISGSGFNPTVGGQPPATFGGTKFVCKEIKNAKKTD